MEYSITIHVFGNKNFIGINTTKENFITEFQVPSEKFEAYIKPHLLQHGEIMSPATHSSVSILYVRYGIYGDVYVSLNEAPKEIEAEVVPRKRGI
jgi:hypothetical protein